MNPINKYEATAIFMSVAVMAVTLATIRFVSNNGFESFVSEAPTQQATIIAATDRDNGASISNAVIDSISETGELEKLIIDDVRIGTGRVVGLGDTVTVEYIGSTPDGKQFDNSYTRGEPFTFTVGAGDVIAGWEQGIVGMREGGQRILVIPPSLAYGSAQVGPIAPNSILVFAIELLRVK
jgi:FKBP-type peptidyl-prolyl cis-trans isomerase